MQNVERAFGLLVKQFPRLHLLNQKSTRKKIKVILSACALHNIYILENDNIEHYLRKPRNVSNKSEYKLEYDHFIITER